MAIIKCDPQCGRGCTKAQYDRQRRYAHALRAKLGPSWTVRVWDNLGWHHVVVSKNQCIYVTDRHASGTLPLPRYSSTRYYAYISDTPGEQFVCYEGYGSTPRAAVSAAACKLRVRMAQLKAAAKDLQSIVREF